MQTESKTASTTALAYRNHRPEIMTYARLGKTNIVVSRIGLGGYNNSERGVTLI